MQGLFAAPDGAERRFLVFWTGAWLIGLALTIVVIETVALLRARTPEGPMFDVYGAWFETLAFLLLSVLAPIFPWMALSPLYRRPSLAAWLGWMVLSLVLVIVLMGVALLSMISTDGVARSFADFGPLAWFLTFLTDVSAKGGYIFAFLALAWRPGVAMAVAIAGLTLLLMAGGLSSITNEIIYSAETFAEETTWGQGIVWADVPAWMLETIVLGLGSAAAIVVGFRWHARDVESRIFD